MSECLMQRLQRLLQATGDGEIVDRTREMVVAQTRDTEPFFVEAASEIKPRQVPALFTADLEDEALGQVQRLLPAPRSLPATNQKEETDHVQ